MRIVMLAVFLLSSSRALTDDPYYEVSCELQAEHARSLTVMRDKGYSKKEVAAAIQDTYPANYHDALIATLDTVFTVKSRSPEQWYATTKTDCENYGKRRKRTSPYASTGTEARGFLSREEMQSCLELHNWLVDARDELTSYERRLEVLNLTLKSSFEQINAAGDTVSDGRIDQHNAAAMKFETLNDEYRTLAQRVNIRSESFNVSCGGKARQ